MIPFALVATIALRLLWLRTSPAITHRLPSRKDHFRAGTLIAILALATVAAATSKPPHQAEIIPANTVVNKKGIAFTFPAQPVLEEAN